MTDDLGQRMQASIDRADERWDRILLRRALTHQTDPRLALMALSAPQHPVDTPLVAFLKAHVVEMRAFVDRCEPVDVLSQPAIVSPRLDLRDSTMRVMPR